MLLYAMVEFKVVKWERSPNLCVFFLILFCRLFYAGACEKQMPEVLSMIQVKTKFSTQYQQDSIPTSVIQIIQIMSLTK